MHKSEGVFVAVDVSKAHLDVAVHGEVEVRRVVNDEQGVQALVAELVQVSPSLVVLEATGGFEMPAAAALAAAEVPIVIANPRQTRDFARSTGQLSKTDAIDARGLALFAARVRPNVRELPSEDAQALDALVARRRADHRHAHPRKEPPRLRAQTRSEGHPQAPRATCFSPCRA